MHQQEGTISRLVQKIEILCQIHGLLSPAHRLPQQIPALVVRAVAAVMLKIALLALRDRAQLDRIWDLDLEVRLLLQLYIFAHTWKLAERILSLGREFLIQFLLLFTFVECFTIIEVLCRKIGKIKKYEK